MRGAGDARDRRSIYDLATASADYPDWPGPPHATIVLCGHPRSGSTLLGEIMYDAGGLGCPLEYFHIGFRPGFAKRWNAHELTSFVRAVHRFRTDRTGVLSAKLFWRDVEEILRERNPWQAADGAPAGDQRATFEVLREIFPNPTFVYLRRMDRVRQAVSAMIAEQTNAWRSFSSSQARASSPEVTYEYERILSLMASADYCYEQWERFFDENRITPLRLSYETLINPDRAALGQLLEALGADVQPSPPRLQRQADARSESFVRRFLHDYARRAGAD
jgi:LPS sulfotransferase NodH